MLGQVFNTTSYFQRKNVIETLIDSKSKVKDTLGEQFGCLNGASNQILFAEHFENEFSKSAYAKQNPNKASFAGLQKQWTKANYITKSMNVNTRSTYNFPGLTYHQQQPIKGRSLQHCLTGSYSQRLFNVNARTNPLVLAQTKLSRVQDFPNVHRLIKKVFLKKETPNMPPVGRQIKNFVKNLQKVTKEQVTLSYLEVYKILLVEIPSQNSFSSSFSEGGGKMIVQEVQCSGSSISLHSPSKKSDNLQFV